MDKFRTVMPISTRFSAGEVVDPTKLDGFALQTKRASSILEYAIGDLWNSAGDSFLQAVGIIAYATMVPNISRYLGITSLLNPRIPNTSDVTQYVHVPLAADVSKHELFLSLPPTSGTSFTFTGTSVPTTLKTTLSAVIASGDWYINRTTGYCFFFNPIQANWTISYIPTVVSEMGSDATFNVMPDPNTHASYGFQGCKIAYTNNVDNSEGYIIYLPPRGPLSATRRSDRAPQSSYDASANSNNMSIDPANVPVKMWQHYDNVGVAVDATTGSYAEHYRYRLPKLITDNWSASSSLPAGFVYLWDPSQTGTFIEGLTVAAENAPSPRKYVLIASGSALDDWITNYMASAYSGCGGTAALTQRDDHDPSFYPSTGLRVVTVGNSISAALSQLAKSFLDHDHGSANSHPGKPISHSKLIDSYSASGNVTGVTFPPSGLRNDWHPEYLHRGGYNATRDQYSNGMFGDLLMLSTTSGSSYQNLSSDSNRIRFGSIGGPQLGYRVSTTLLDILGSGLGIQRNADYFSILMDGSGRTLLSTTVGRLVLNPYNKEIGLGPVANGDYLNYYAGTYLGIALGNVGVARFVQSGGNVGLHFGTSGQRLVQASGGNILKVESQAETIASGKGGQLETNRIWGGTYDHQDGPDNYGEQGGGWGPVRRFVMSPEDFTLYDYPSTVDITPLPQICHRDKVAGYDSDATGRKANVLYLVDSGNDTEAFGYIKLPYAYYGIVNILFSFKSSFAMNTGYGQVALGYSVFDPTGVLPSGETAIASDFGNCNGVSLGSTAWQHNGGLLIRAFNVDTSPRVEVNNVYGAALPKNPWVRFHMEEHGGGYHFLISDITVLYRIKEW